MPRSLTGNELTSNVDFVLEVEKHPCLYNSTLEEYSKRDVVDAAWEKVSEAYGEAVCDCRDKWKNLRTVFVRSLRPRSRGSGRKTPYYLNEYMQFLIPFVKNQNTDETPSNLQSPGDEDECHYSGKNKDDGIESEDEDEITEASTRNNPITVGRRITRQELGCSEKATPGGIENPKIKRIVEPDIDSYVEYFQEKKRKLGEPYNHRKLFLLSLLPEIESMTVFQFRLLRRNILDAVDNALGLSYEEAYHEISYSIYKES